MTLNEAELALATNLQLAYLPNHPFAFGLLKTEKGLRCFLAMALRS
jgi:hypothetical protein